MTSKALLKKHSVNTLVGYWPAKFAVEVLTDRNYTNSILCEEVPKDDLDDSVAVRNGYLNPRRFPNFCQAVDNTDPHGKSERESALNLNGGYKMSNAPDERENNTEAGERILQRLPRMAVQAMPEVK